MRRSAGCPFGGPPSCAAALQIESLSLQSSLPERFSGVTPSAAAPALFRRRALLHGQSEGYRGLRYVSKTRLAARVGRARLYLSVRIYVIMVLRSASLTCGLGGIGTCPQTPEPPFLTLSVSLAAAPASPLYLAATST